MKELFKMFFSFKGRLNRLRYFMYGIPLGIIILIAYVITLVQIVDPPTTKMYITLVVYFLIIITCSISGISLSVRRLHDLDKPGWLILIQLLSFIPVLKIISAIFGLYLLFAPGNAGPNQYGNDPLENDFMLYDKSNLD